MDPQEIKALVAWAKSQGKSDEEIAATLKAHGVNWSPPSPLKKAIHGGSAAFLQGVSLNLAGKIAPDLKKAADEFNAEHSVAGPIANIAGGLTSAAALPVGLGASALARGLTGAGAAGVSALAGGKDLKSAAEDAAVGGVAGAAIPAAVGAIAKPISRFVNPRFFPGKTVAKAVGPLLPDDAAQVMARQEALAPGASVPANLSPEIPAAVRVIGADPAVARKAQIQSVERLKLIKSSMQAFKPKYDALLKGKVAPTSTGNVDITKIVTDNGLMPMNGQVQLTVVQRLRHDVLNKLETAKGMKRGELGEAYAKLSEWLHQTAPGIQAIDSDYGVLARMKKAETEILKNIRQSRKAYASAGAAGITPGSPAGRLPTQGGMMSDLFHPERAPLAQQAHSLLLQPGQIPGPLLNARNKAMGMGRFSPGLLSAFGMGEQIPNFTGGLLGQ